ncbi:hypothetical protein ACDA63_17205 [Uliginosibacterium sp. sgz301328]
MNHIMHVAHDATHKPLADKALSAACAFLSALAPYAIAAAALLVYHYY